MSQPRLIQDAPEDRPVLVWLANRWQTAFYDSYSCQWKDTEHEVPLPDDPWYWCELPQAPWRTLAQQEWHRHMRCQLREVEE